MGMYGWVCMGGSVWVGMYEWVCVGMSVCDRLYVMLKYKCYLTGAWWHSGAVVGT